MQIDPILLGILVAFANFIISVAVVLIGIKRKHNDLGKLVLIVFVVRYIIIASIIRYLFSVYSKEESFDLGISFMISTFIFIMIEIIIFHYASNFVFLYSEKKDNKSEDS